MKNKLKNIALILIAISIFLAIFQDVIFYPEKYKNRLPFDPKPLDRSITTYVEADLGGMKVKIPNNLGYIEWKNWNGQGNDWDPEASKIKYEKTHLRGFSFVLKYPQMNGKDETRELFHNYIKHRSKVQPDGSFWIEGIVTSGESIHLNEKKYFSNHYRHSNDKNKYPSLIYKKMDSKKYEFEVYQLSEIDKKGIPYRKSSMASDYYFYIEDGLPKAYATCPPYPKRVESCHLYFTLLPKSNTLIQVSFHHTQLHKWKEIMQAVRQFYFNFEVK